MQSMLLMMVGFQADWWAGCAWQGSEMWKCWRVADGWLLARAQDCDMKDYYYPSHSKSCYFPTSAPTLFRNRSGGWAEFLVVRSSPLQMPKLAGNGCWSQQGCSTTGMGPCLGCIALVKTLMTSAVTAASSVAACLYIYHSAPQTSREHWHHSDSPGYVCFSPRNTWLLQNLFLILFCLGTRFYQLSIQRVLSLVLKICYYGNSQINTTLFWLSMNSIHHNTVT